MKIGIIGLPQTGKKTLFTLLTRHTPSEKELAAHKPIVGIADIRDGRFDRLVALYAPAKNVRARIDIAVLPKIEKDSVARGDIFKDIMDVDALCHVVRAFADDAIYHVDGSVDPKRDIDAVNAELIINDLIFVEKRLERIDKNIKKASDETSAQERELLVRLKAHLDKELPLRVLELSAEEKKAVSAYPLVTLKEMIVVLNVSENEIADHQRVQAMAEAYRALRLDILAVSAKVEAEIAAFESEADRTSFLKELKIEKPAIDALTQLCIKNLNLISFFTVGKDEVRQWTIRAGSSAPEAAGAIHSDLQKGFIRAEVIKYSDINTLGSEDAVKAAGKFLLKGKDYIVEDGDLLTIRFNV